MSESTTIITETRGAVGTISLNRPERRNALSPEMLLALHDVLGGWASSGDIRALVIRGAGDKAFSAGYDIAAIPTNLDPESERLLREKNPLEIGLESVKNFPYPTIAMLNGHCFGGALNLAMCCDIRIAVEDALIGMPPAKLGVVYPPDGIAQFVQVVGMSRAREIFFTGHSYKGAQVLEMGLADRMISRSELQGAVYELAEEIAGNAPLALRGLKRIMNMLEAKILLDGPARAEAESLVAEAMSSEDIREGQMAFLEKRKPAFKGR